MFKIFEDVLDFFLPGPSGAPGTYGEKMPTAAEVLEEKREEMLEVQVFLLCAYQTAAIM